MLILIKCLPEITEAITITEKKCLLPSNEIEKTLNKNQITINKQFKQLYQQTEANSEKNKFNIEILKTYLDTLVIIKALIIFIVVRNLSFTLIK
jgi:hypothetical protein